MQRRLEPELLDHLAADDLAAIASRRDLGRINAVMRQAGIVAKALRDFPRPRLLLDLGGGDGDFLLAVARRLPHWRGVSAIIADRQDIVAAATRDGFAALGWRCTVRQGDAFETLREMEDDTLVLANLFLHHLDQTALQLLFALAAARAAGLVACEPRRNFAALAASRLVFAMGANAVTRHDAVASVRAGFAGSELSALWPPDQQLSGWVLSERSALPFSHLFTARRHAL